MPRSRTVGLIERIAFAAVTLSCVAGLASAQDARLNPKDIAARLQKSGYPHIHSIEFEHGRYEVEARDAREREFTLSVNPNTGVAESKSIGWAKLTESDFLVGEIVKNAKSAGVEEVYAIEREHAMYEIVARGAGNRLIKIFAHPRTGRLIRFSKSGKLLSKKINRADAAGPLLSLDTILALIAKAGYREVYAAYPEHDLYEFIARDANGQLGIWLVDPKTGNIQAHP